MRKFGTRIASLSLIFMLSGCGDNKSNSTNTISGSELIESGCVYYKENNEAAAYILFGKAARQNPDWIPVAQAASILRFAKSTPGFYGKTPEISLNAISLIDGLCHK